MHLLIQMKKLMRFLRYVDHIVFNSFQQWNKFKDKVKNVSSKKIECGIRINPEYSEIETRLCTIHAINIQDSGLHWLILNQKNLKELMDCIFTRCVNKILIRLERTVKVVDEKFGEYIKKMKWLNFGGGHHITRPDYDIETLSSIPFYF